MKKIGDSLVNMSRKMEIPTNIVRNVSKIEIISNDTLNIESHKGILHYDDTEIHINCGEFVLRILGFNLSLGAISSIDLVITGDIKTVDFLK